MSSEVKTLKISRTYAANGKIRETDTEEPVEVPAIPDGVAAHVTYARGKKINLGNYESARIDVRISLPCCVAEIHDCYETAKRLVSERIDQEIFEVEQ